MTDARSSSSQYLTQCLEPEEFYLYLSEPPEKLGSVRIESHLASCDSCRSELAGLLRLLDHEAADQCQESLKASSAEIAGMVALVQEVSRSEKHRKASISLRPWIQWSAAAAAALVLIVAGTWASKYYSDRAKSERFLAQAKESLEVSYDSQSPSGLRLNLPFHSSATHRAAEHSESLSMAKAFFYQALAVREGLLEARLGLGYIYLNGSKFLNAKGEFQRVLDVQLESLSALIGRGAAHYEGALKARDHFRRDSMLNQALADFNAVLAHPNAPAEARYNKIWTLHRLGRHREVLQEIEAYLTQDSESIWSARLLDLSRRIGER